MENVDVSGSNYVGALAGHANAGWGGNRGLVFGCYVTGRVSGDYLVGGLIGSSEGWISNCYTTADVLGIQCVGGLVGGHGRGLIYNCYARGKVAGNTQTGGLVAGTSSALVASFWDIETSGQASSGGGKGKTTAEMKMASTYYGWGGCGNEGVWTIDEGNDYPRLAWEGKPGQPIPKQQLSDSVTGSGTETDPYLIYTAEQLNLIGLFPCEWDKHFKLMDDINMSAYRGIEFNLIGVTYWWPFAGIFDGNGHTLSKFTYDSVHKWGAADFVGFFSSISNSAVVKDLGLLDVNVVGYQSVGGLAGMNSGGTVYNCYATGMVSASWRAGGLIGWNEGTVNTSWATASVSWGHMLGGLVGDNTGTLSNCYTQGTTSGAFDFSGVGGLVGNNEGNIYNCYAAGPVLGKEKSVGGLVGWDISGTVASAFWDTQTTGQTLSAGGVGKTTTQMQTAATFLDAGWDFVNIWDHYCPVIS